MKKTVIIAVVIGILAGVGGRFMLHGSAAGTKADTAAQGEPVATVAANGVVEGVRPESALRAETVGAIARICVHENDKVEAGQLLAELANGPQEANVALARAELGVAEQQLKKLEAGERPQTRSRAKAEVEAKAVAYDLARRDYERAQQSRMGVSASDQDSARTRLNLAKADWEKAKADLAAIEEGTRPEDIDVGRRQVEAARAKLKVAQAELARTRVTAPYGGRVLQVLAEPGEAAGPTSARPIMILADLSKRRVRAFIEEFDVGRIRVGQPAVATADGLPGQEFPGHVAVVLDLMGKRGAPSDAPGEYKDVYFREVLIDLDGGQELPLNLRVQTRIQVK
jgi:multidrug resistance efflux pump